MPVGDCKEAEAVLGSASSGPSGPALYSGKKATSCKGDGKALCCQQGYHTHWRDELNAHTFCSPKEEETSRTLLCDLEILCHLLESVSSITMGVLVVL